MAYMSQENKASKVPTIKAILRKYGVKASIAVRHYSTLVLNIKSGQIDFVGNFNQTCSNDAFQRDRFQPVTAGYIQVNEYHYHDHFTGQARECIGELVEAMNVGNHDNSRPEVDHFDVGWYTDVNIGKWNQPYIFTKG